MKLLGSLTSPYVRKVRIVLAEKKLDYEFVLENASQPDLVVSQFNPLGKVPCLLIDGRDGIESMFDSRVIVTYLDGLRPGSQLIPDTGRTRTLVGTWEALADGMIDAAVLAKLEATWAHRRDDQRCQAWIDFQMNKVKSSLIAMERAVNGNGFIVGNALSLADIAVGAALGYLDFRFKEVDWRAMCPKLEIIYTKLQSRPSFVSTQPL